MAKLHFSPRREKGGMYALWWEMQPNLALTCRFKLQITWEVCRLYVHLAADHPEEGAK